MPRGTKDGSIFLPKEKRDPETGHLTRIVVRRRYTDLKGRPREKKRYAFTETEAERLKRSINKEIADELAGVSHGGRAKTFADLIVYYKAHELKPAEYVGETKIGGLRSFKKFQSRLKPIEKFFGQMDLPAITYTDLEEFKLLRLKTPIVTERWQVVKGKKRKVATHRQRSIASVDRELSQLKHLFFLALRERWIAEHPFHRGKPLIQTADEVKRMRILTWTEEERLMAACVGPRKHLRLEILFAVETAVRQNEQFTLELRDVDMKDRIATVRAFNAKSAQTRVVPISERLHSELTAKVGPSFRLVTQTLPVFPEGNPRRSFATACRLAGITGLRWHDLRHTAITRLLHFYKLSPAEVMKISGHTNYKTFLRYVNIDRDIAKSLAARIDAARAEVATAVVESPELSTEVVQ